jgi:hypothetical protein
MSTETTSTSDNVEIYRELEEYPWDTDKEFQVRRRSSHTIPDQPRHHSPKHQHHFGQANNLTSSDWTHCNPRTQPVTISTSRPHAARSVFLPVPQEVHSYRFRRLQSLPHLQIIFNPKPSRRICLYLYPI